MKATVIEERHLSPAQIRGARGMLDWSRSELAQAARLSVSTIKRIEAGDPQPVSEGAHASVKAALEVAGLRFTSTSSEDGLTLSKGGGG